MQSVNYKILGKIPAEIISEFKQVILQGNENISKYSWIPFNAQLEEMFMTLFTSLPLNIQYNPYTKQKVQKVLYTPPGRGFTIHKDGVRCKSALNIAISANNSDWVRWYTDEDVHQFGQSNYINQSAKGYGYSRDTNIKDFEAVPYIDELFIEEGTVYILDVGKYHSFKCNGSNPRIIIQTKFEGFPDFSVLRENITPEIFKNLIPL